MPSDNMGRPVKNKHNVPQAQWGKWSNRARATFNEMHYSMRPSMQFAFTHPSAQPRTREQWDTTRWNAAWTAAQIANERGVLGRVKTVA